MTTTHHAVKLRPHFRKSKRTREEHLKARAAGSGPWTVPALCAHYGLKPGMLTAGGAPLFPGGGTIGIYEAGGGWVASDVQQFFSSISQPVPNITDVSVDGTKNQGANGGDASVEVALDIQVAAAVYQYLTQKTANLRMYWGQDIGAAAVASSKDGCAACSCSWGQTEKGWGAAGLAAMQADLLTCTGAGTPFFAASGDNDADDSDGTGKPSVDAPASCTNAVACGGTTTPQTGASSVWNNNPGSASGEGTGGGYSATFPFPAWCSGPPGNGKMVSDVAGNADPDTGFEIVQGGQEQVVGGTSAVAPFWAGLVAALGPNGLGFLNARIWAAKAAAAAVTTGSNGAYGGSVCCGVGTVTAAFAAALAPGQSAPPATGGTGLLSSAQVSGVQTALAAFLETQKPLIENKEPFQQAVAATIAALGPAT